MARSIGRTVLIAGVVGLPFVSFGLAVFVHMRDGHAADTYQNVYGWNIPWTTPAAFGAVLALAGLASWFVRWWTLWRRSRLEGIAMSESADELKRHD